MFIDDFPYVTPTFRVVRTDYGNLRRQRAVVATMTRQADIRISLRREYT
jgi:hypothetical protein